MEMWEAGVDEAGEEHLSRDLAVCVCICQHVGGSFGRSWTQDMGLRVLPQDRNGVNNEME